MYFGIFFAVVLGTVVGWIIIRFRAEILDYGVFGIEKFFHWILIILVLGVLYVPFHYFPNLWNYAGTILQITLFFVFIFALFQKFIFKK
jgi:hypothetical protein